MFFRFLFLTLLSALFCSVFVGCVRVETNTRSISRLRPLRKTPVLASGVSEQPISLRANSDLLTEEEFLDVKLSMKNTLQKYTNTRELNSAAIKNAKLEIQRATLDAFASAKSTVFRGTCRVALIRDELVLAEASAETLRSGGPKVITEDRAKEIASLERNPLLRYSQSERALVDACLAAAEKVEAVDEPDLAKETTRARLRKSALLRLDKAPSPDTLAAALIELGDYGESSDGVIVLLRPEIDFTRGDLPARAAAYALAQLCPSQSKNTLKRLLEGGVHQSVKRDLEKALRCSGALATTADAH